MLLCSLAHRVTGEEAFLARARADLLAAAAFPDWNPSHFLDVAEMSAGMALGYDWLFDALSEADRAAVRGALTGKALRLVEHGHHTFMLPNNWAQVCGGGLTLAALALADEDPALAAAVLGRVRAGAGRPLEAYRPDGCYAEGPMYWNYGTSYEVLLVSALRGCLGDDWGILKSEGFLRSAEYVAQCTGPTGLFFNYPDCDAREGLNETLCMMAREQGRPALAWNSLRILEEIRRGVHDREANRPGRFGPLLVFWWPFGKQSPGTEPPALFFSGRGANPIAVWRSAWGDPRARYFAIKAGGAGLSHGHMDPGSFVLDWRGRRWASDLGMQDYNSLESRGIKLWDMGQASPRWHVYRLGAEAHNTLTVEGFMPDARALATLEQADAQGACLDLSSVLFLEPGQVRRFVSIEKTRIVLEDRLERVKPGLYLRWAMTTPAAIKVAGPREVVLTQGGESLTLHFEGAEVLIAAEDISRPREEYDAPNPGMSQVVVRFRAGAEGNVLLRTVIEASE